MKRSPVFIEHVAQQRARGVIITGPEHPIIASRPFNPRKILSAQDKANARRWADFHNRYAGQSAPLLQLWSA